MKDPTPSGQDVRDRSIILEEQADQLPPWRFLKKRKMRKKADLLAIASTFMSYE